MTTAKLLVVEDEKDLLYGLRDILEIERSEDGEQAYEVLIAENGEQALEILESDPDSPPDLILSDIMMPRMDGLELLKRVRAEEKWVSIPFIFLTARGEREDIYLGRNLGVDEYIIKPYEAEDLILAVRTRLKRSAAIHKAQVGMVSDIKKQILTMFNHEFRTPLTLVVAYADMLKDYDQEDMSQEELLQFLKGVNSGAERLRRLIENFILLVEIDAGDAKKNFEMRATEIIDPLEIIQPAIDNVVLDTSQYDLVIDVPDKLPEFKGDLDYLRTAVCELIDNAVKFSKKGSRIVIGAHADYTTIYFWVKDEGRGVPDEHVNKIWDSFYQINRSQLEDQGAGVGLAIVRGIAKIHKGDVQLETEVGKGSTFKVVIPR